MIIKVKQVRGYGESGVSISIGPLQSKEASIKYEAYINDSLSAESFLPLI